MDLQEKYTEETGQSKITIEHNNGMITFTCEYVEWLEKRILPDYVKIRAKARERF